LKHTTRYMNCNLARFSTLLCLSLFSTSFFLGCGSKDSGKAKAPREYIIDSSIGDASTLIPALASDTSSLAAASYVYNGLVKYDRDLSITGDLAESWDISEDGLKITFHLRKGVKWHDGAPFTSHDVMFTYKTMVSPKTPTAYAESYLQVKSATMPDDYTFVATYSKPFAKALISWGLNILPKHLLEGKDITKSPLGRHPIGTGAYRFKEWKTGEKLVFIANNEYFEGRPGIGKVIIRIIPDPTAIFVNLKAGQVDRAGLTPFQYKYQTGKESFKKNFERYEYLAFSYTYLGYNLTRPLFKDVRVRQAISYAIDKKELVEKVLLGYGKEATGPYKPGTWVYNQNVKKYPYDIRKAKSLFAEAGWKDSDGDGILDKNGKAFSFEIITNQGNVKRKKTATIIQRKLKEVGVQVKIRIIEWAAFLKEFVHKKNFDALILGWGGGPEPDIYNVWHSSKTKPGELNHISYKNSEVDELLEKGRRTFKQSERKKYYDRIQEILAEEQPYTFLYVAEDLSAIQKRFKGIVPSPLGIDYNFTKWTVEE